MTRLVACNEGREFLFDPAKTALLSIDFQRDFIDPEGFCGRFPGGVESTAAIVPRATHVLAAARIAGLHVVHTREGYSADFSDVNDMKRARGVVGSDGPLGRFLIVGSEGQKTAPAMAPLPAAIPRPIARNT